MTLFANVSFALPAQRAGLHRAPSARDAGVLHLADGAWTRKVASASIGADVIYDNTCPTPYFAAFSGDTFSVVGRLPSPTSPTTPISRPGCATSYLVDGFQIAYCTDRASLGTYTVDFVDQHPACTSLAGVVPTASFAITGLPASSSGLVACWTVTLDLDGPALPPLAFTMRADGDGVYAAPESANAFTWSMSSSLAASELSSTGPLVAGLPSACSRFDGTFWDDVVIPGEAGTGMGALSTVFVDGGPTPAGCWIVEWPFTGFHLELYGDACDASSPGVSFCFGDGSGAACPCGNASAPGVEAGCAHSLGGAAHLDASGYARLSVDTLTLDVASVPPNTSVLFFQGTMRTNGGAGAVFGDGLRCAGGSIARIGVRAQAVGGLADYPQGNEPSVSVRGGVLSPGTRTYQAWYRNGAAFCTSSTFNLSNGYEIAWSS